MQKTLDKGLPGFPRFQKGVTQSSGRNTYSTEAIPWE